MTKDELYTQAVELLDSNDELFIGVVNELDSYMGLADGWRGYAMEELDEFYPESAKLLAVISWGNFDYSDNYFIDTIYGLESTDDLAESYRDEIDSKELLNSAIEYWNHICIIEDDKFVEVVQQLFNRDYDDEEE